MTLKADSSSFLIKASEIDASFYENSRLYENKAAEDKLLASIENRVEKGESPLINSITVGPLGEDGCKGYPLKAGFTRWRALARAGITEIQIKVDSRPFLEVNADENLDRADLHIAEVVNVAGRFQDSGDDVPTIVKKMKSTTSSVKNYLRVYNCKPIWDAWKAAVSDPKRHEFAPKLEETIKLVGEYNETQKAAIANAKIEAAKLEVLDAYGKPVSKEEAATPKAKKLLEEAVTAKLQEAEEKVAEKFAEKVEKAAEKRKEKAKEKAQVTAATGKGPAREPGKKKPSTNKMLSEIQDLKVGLAYAEGLKSSKETDQAIVAISAAIEVLKWVRADITTPISTKNAKCQVVADMVRAAKTAADEAEKARKAA